MSETNKFPVGSTPCDHHWSEEPMLQEDRVQETCVSNIFR